MSSMSPPAGSPEPSKRGRGRGKRGAPGGGPSGRGGAGRGRKKQRRESTAPREGSASIAGTPLAFPLSLPPIGGYGTPSGSGSTPLAFNLSPEHSGAGGASRTREGSTFSSSRRSNTTRGGAGGVATTGAGTQAGGSEVEDDEEEEEGDNELDLLLGDAEYDEQAKERSEAKEALRLLLDQFSPEQIERYEVYRRSGFQKIAIRRLINHVLQQSCSPNIIVAVRGLAKVFVGEIVEAARQVQAESGQSGPLVPDDIREAYRRYTATSDKRGSDRAKLFVR